MAGTSKRIWVFLIATSGIAPLAYANDPPPVHYDIRLDVKQNTVEAITVRATVRTGDDGIVDFDPPKQSPAEVHAERGQLDTSVAGRWRVTAAPGTDIALAWRSQKPEPMSTLSMVAWEKAVAPPDAVFSYGAIVLAVPRGPGTRKVTATMTLPPGWLASSDLTNGTLNAANLTFASILASRELYSTTHPVGASTLHLGSIGTRRQEADSIATLLASSLNALRSNVAPKGAASNDSTAGATQLTVNLITLNEGDAWGSSAGGASATIFLSHEDPSRAWLFEILRSLASADEPTGDASTAWFTQGFNGYRVASALRAEGMFDNVTFARHIDQTLGMYGGSPFRRVSNARVVEDYDRIREMQSLPSARGELFAWLLDARMREATQGRKSLADALRRMDAEPAAAHTALDPGPALIAAVAAEGGGDIAPLYQRYIVDGQLLQLPRDALGPCFSIGTVAYDYGWQQQHVFAKASGTCEAPGNAEAASVGAASAVATSVGAASAAKPGRDTLRR
jgi:hypothetical protein